MMICISDGVIQPMCAVMYSKWDVFYYVKKWDGCDFDKIMGFYLETLETFYDSSEPPLTATKGDMIMINEKDK